MTDDKKSREINENSEDQVDRVEVVSSADPESKNADEKDHDSNTVANQEVDSEPGSENTTGNQVLEKSVFSKLFSLVVDFWNGLMARQVISKVLALVFALIVFGFAYMHMSPHRSVLTYMGVMLLMVLVYAEILVIRDHLWVIEGSMRESKRWRDIFFNHTTLRRQRLRKFVLMFFTMIVFSYIFVKSHGKADPMLSFMGIILMITILYYEILSIRDEVWVMTQALIAGQLPEKPVDGKNAPQHFISRVDELTEGKSENKSENGLDCGPEVKSEE